MTRVSYEETAGPDMQDQGSRGQGHQPEVHPSEVHTLWAYNPDLMKYEVISADQIRAQWFDVGQCKCMHCYIKSLSPDRTAEYEPPGVVGKDPGEMTWPLYEDWKTYCMDHLP